MTESIREMFGLAEEKCVMCQMKLTDDAIESHRKKFCSIDCMQEYLIELKEAEIMKKLKRVN